MLLSLDLFAAPSIPSPYNYKGRRKNRGASVAGGCMGGGPAHELHRMGKDRGEASDAW
jgi:hypothetical protein